MKAKRVFIIVLDSYGIGAEPDADKFGDVGANTLASIVKSEKYDTPNLKKMGLFNIQGVDCAPGVEHPTASFARMQETSMGKIPPLVTGKSQESFLRNLFQLIRRVSRRRFWNHSER